MISVTLSHGKNAELRGLKAVGHANYATHGADIVCAAVSVLVRVAVLQLNDWAVNVDGLDVSTSFREKGNAEVRIEKYDESMLCSLKHLFCFLQLGFESIAFEYPSHVCVNIEFIE